MFWFRCLYYQTEDVVIILHHVVAIVFMSACLYLGVSGAEVVATIFESEVTSIVLNVSVLLMSIENFNFSRCLTKK